MSDYEVTLVNDNSKDTPSNYTVPSWKKADRTFSVRGEKLTTPGCRRSNTANTGKSFSYDLKALLRVCRQQRLFPLQLYTY